MLRYNPREVDTSPTPVRFFTEPRYVGYQGKDYNKPYAKYFREQCLPIQPHINDALLASPYSGAYSQRLSTLADDMARPGYLPVENGYTINDDGHIVVAALTDMPGVTAEMWDWWAWWHGVEPQRYKLWHPNAHVFATFTQDRSQIKGLSDRQRAHGNTSYIEEYIGAERAYLRATMYDPEKLGFTCKPGETIIAARGGSSEIPVAAIWIFHFIRETSNGCEMRSRFFANDMRVLPLSAHSVTTGLGKLMTLPIVKNVASAVINRSKPSKLHEFGPDLLRHCAQEMNHLASFLPQIYAEFATESRV